MAEEKELKSLVEFFHVTEKLKLEKRRGWIDRKLREPESVADHSFRLALMAFFFAQRQGLDVNKCIKMALIHDLPEAICGDVATRIREELQEIPDREKQAREEEAMREELKLLPKGIGKEVRALWDEFNKRETREARLVYELDRLEAIFQAVEYEKRGNFKVSLQEFFDYGNARIKNKELRKVFERLLEERKK